MFEPAVKWSGSKRSQAEEIVKLFPKEIDTYYEPFCGGCNVIDKINFPRKVASDKQHYLIELFKNIQIWLKRFYSIWMLATS